MPWKESYSTTAGKRYRIVSRDPSGKKHSKTFTRSKDADAYMLDQARREQLGHLWQDDPETFGAFAGITVNDDDQVMLTGDGWFARYKPSVKPSTYDRRRSVIGHLRDLLDVRLDRLTPALVEEHVQVIAEAHPRQGKFVHETIKMILRSAKVRGQRVNPELLDLRPPKYSPKRQRQALTAAEVDALAKASDEPHLIRVAAYTGLRQGELLALRDEDIDLKKKVLHVRGNVYDRVRYDTPKTKRSKRSVPLSALVVREIKLQRLKRPTGTTVLFPGPKGDYASQTLLERRFKAWAEAIGRDITFHDLRSTFASFAVKAKVYPKTLQALMGHESLTTTMDLYAQYDDEDAVAAVTALSVPHQQRASL